MSSTIKLPECIEARRIGYHAESEYDEFGEAAPITWICGCGARLRLEHYEVIESEIYGEYIGNRWYPEIVSEGYVAVSQERKDEFLAKHSSCKNTCWKCRQTEVEFIDQWCFLCQEHEDGAHVHPELGCAMCGNGDPDYGIAEF